MSTAADDFEEDDGDDWTVADMTVGEYRRMSKRIESEGREVFSDEELSRFDEADAVMSATGKQVWQAVQRLMPDTGDAVRRVRDLVRESWSPLTTDEDLIEQSFQAPMIDPSPVDDRTVNALADAANERRDRELKQVNALESIAGHMAEMKAEQMTTSTAAKATTSEVERLRADGRRSGRWTIGLGVVSAAAASVAALLAVLAYLNPPA